MTGDPGNAFDTELQSRRASWSRYWSSGVLHSCPGSFRDNYDGALAQFWHAQFAALKPGQRVLDVATGNGALPRLLLGVDGGADCGCTIDAIDLATLAPAWLDRLDADRRARLHLHPGVLAEQLPFEDACFDLVISQYGIEYAELAVALAQVRRVLGPGGRLRLLMHHRASVPVEKGDIEARLIETLFADDGLFAAAGRMLPWIAMSGTATGRVQLQGNAAANRDRATFNACQQALDRTAGQLGADAAVLGEARAQVQQLLALVQARGLEVAGAGLSALREYYAEQGLRARDLVHCAHDESRMQALLETLGALGFATASARPIHYQAHLMGWAVSADLPPAIENSSSRS